MATETLKIEIDPAEVPLLIAAISDHLRQAPHASSGDLHAKNCLQRTLDCLKDMQRFQSGSEETQF